MQKQIERLDGLIKCYRDCNLKNNQSGDLLNELLKDISAILYFLEPIRARQHELFQAEIHLLVSQKKSVNRAENDAHVKYPEYYLLKRIIDSAYKITEAIRSNLSYIKSERNLR